MKLILEGIPFTQVANCVLNDNTLSFGAKGMFAYIASKPSGWDFSSERIVSDTSDGLRSVQSILRELEGAGYLRREKLPNGRVQYLITHSKSLYAESAESQNSILLKAQSAESGSISNKDIKEIKSKRNKESKTSEEDLGKIQFIFAHMRKVNPTVHSVITHKVQRDACIALMNTFGTDEVLRRIQAIPEMKGDYVPSITTPHELYVKWSKMDKFINKKENNVFIL